MTESEYNEIRKDIDYSKEYDCFDYGCGECKVCQYLSFLDWAESCAIAGSTIQRDAEMEKYLKDKEALYEVVSNIETK